MIRIVLVEPEIPQNTGNIARTCACTGSPLLIAGPMGFTITEARVKRAGLDYWPMLDLTIYPDYHALMREHAGGSFWYFSSTGQHTFTDVRYGPDSYLVFGKETQGLGPQILSGNTDRCVRIPMVPKARCLNLSNCVSVALYEALRQNGYPKLT